MLYGEGFLGHENEVPKCLNPYFFGKCSTAKRRSDGREEAFKVLILIFLENALRLSTIENFDFYSVPGLNPYFFGKCSTAGLKITRTFATVKVLILIFFGKCSTACIKRLGFGPFFLS